MSLRVVLVSNIAGFTRLTGLLGDDRAAILLARHDSVVDAALDQTGGRLEDRTGDGAVATFTSVTEALDCAGMILRDLALLNSAHPHTPLHVRIGLAVGEPLRVDGALFGTVVQLAARLCEAARPGRVLVCRTIRDLTAGKPYRFETAGRAHLKGFAEPVETWELDRHHPAEATPLAVPGAA
jgi:class 3 adenylate cyclase